MRYTKYLKCLGLQLCAYLYQIPHCLQGFTFSSPSSWLLRSSKEKLHFPKLSEVLFEINLTLCSVVSCLKEFWNSQTAKTVTHTLWLSVSSNTAVFHVPLCPFGISKRNRKNICFASGKKKQKTKQDTDSISLFLYTLYKYYLITSDVWCPTENNGTFQMGAARFKAHKLRASQICKSLNLDYMLEIVSIKSHLTQFRLTHQSSIFY